MSNIPQGLSENAQGLLPLLCAAHGLKFAQSKVAYHSKEIDGLTSKYANPPVSVKENLGSVMDAIRTKFTNL